MSITIPESHRDLLERRTFPILVTLMPDGSPQASPVWFDYDGEYILVNSSIGRVKDRNMRRDPRVALLFLDPKNPYRYIQIRGRVVEIIEGERAENDIDRLAKKYLGQDRYPHRAPGERRVTYLVRPESVNIMG